MMEKTIKIGDVFKVSSGGTPSRKKPEYFTTGTIPWVKTGDLKGRFANHPSEYITEEALKNSSAKIFPPNTVLLAMYGATIGACSILNFEAATNQACAALLPTVKCEPIYLYYYLKSIKSELIRKGVGGAQPNISAGIIKDTKIPLPPLATQKKIAAILDVADAYRQKTKALIKKYDELSQSLFLDMFGDPVGNPKGWEKKPMGELMKIVRGGSPRPIDKFLGGTYPWIKIGDATKGNDIYLEKTKQHIIEEGLKKTRLLPKGSLIFANCGVSLGFARIIQFEGCIHDGWLAFSELDNTVLNELFLLKALNSITRYFRETAPDGTQPNLNSAIMKNFNVILPPIDLQNRFEVRLKVLIKQKAQAQESLVKAEELFNSLLGRAFKGEIK
jgi:restriction endonuclease S subunit